MAESIYMRLFERAYKFTYASTLIVDPGDPRHGQEVPDHKTMKRVVADPLVAEAYELVLRMRGALGVCAGMFDHLARDYERQRGGLTTIVETQQLEDKISRHRGLARELYRLIDENKMLPPTDWLPIETATRDATPIRVLGKRDTGETYVETTHWFNTRWAIELMQGYGAPTHWRKLEELPEGY